jgi:DHA1 family bicyclomycin/chloramphenicol resistance-like MFS transporter
MTRRRRQGFGQLRFGRRERRRTISHEEEYALHLVHARRSDERVDIVGISGERTLEKAARLRHIVRGKVAINVVTVIAPTAGAALLTIGGWRLIYMIQAAIGTLLLLALVLGFAESARIDPANRLAPAVVIRSYVRVLAHPVSFAYILVGAAGGATVFGYVTGSSLFFIGVVGLRPDQYGLIFSACSAAVMSGALLDSRLGRRGLSTALVLTIGLTLSAAASPRCSR